MMSILSVHKERAELKTQIIDFPLFI